MKLYIQIIAAGVAVVYVVGLWTSGIDLDSNWLRYYSIAVVILTVFWGCWDWWLWRRALHQLYPVSASCPRRYMAGELSGHHGMRQAGKNLAQSAWSISSCVKPSAVPASDC